MHEIVNVGDDVRRLCISSEGNGSSDCAARISESPLKNTFSPRLRPQVVSYIENETSGEPSTLNYQPSTLLAVCRCDEPHCPDLPLTPVEAVLLELSWTKLGRAICGALDLDSRPLDLGLINTRQIGSWSAAAVPVILTIQTDHAWFRGHVLELVSRLKGRFILLAPTSAHYDAVAQELIENANAGFFSLEENVRLLPSGLLQATRTPGKLFARFTPDPRSEPGEDVARQAFALVEQLETGGKAPGALAVFRLYCMEGLSADKVARKLGCSKPTVLRRLKLIEQRVGMRVEKLRRYAPQCEEMEQLDDRAKRHSLS
jgi:hypothetical protein